MTASAYDLHGVRVRVDAEDARVAALIDRRLRHHRLGAVEAGAAFAITLLVTTGEGGPPPKPPGDGRPAYDTPEGQVVYDEGADALWLDHGGRAGFLVDGRGGRARLWAVGADEEAAWLVTHPLLTLVLADLLKRQGRYPLHAAAMSPPGGTVVLFPGGSGAGKTTLALALLDEGWGFLADDTVFLSPRADGATVFGFADEIDVTDDTVAMFPGLEPALNGAVPGRAKRQVLVEDAFPVCPRSGGRPGAMLFPTVAHRPHSVLAPLGPGEALAALAPNVLLTEPLSSQAHLDVLAALVAAVPCWRLETGRDLPGLARRIGDMVGA